MFSDGLATSLMRISVRIVLFFSIGLPTARGKKLVHLVPGGGNIIESKPYEHILLYAKWTFPDMNLLTSEYTFLGLLELDKPLRKEYGHIHPPALVERVR